MTQPFQRALRRLRICVTRSRPGSGHETTIDGHYVQAWRFFEPAAGCYAHALVIGTRDPDEASRIARGYFGPGWVNCTIEPRSWCFAICDLGGSVPAEPFAARRHDPRQLAAAFTPTAGAVRFGNVTLVAAGNE